MGRTRSSCEQRGVKEGLAMDDLSLSEKPVYSTLRDIHLFPFPVRYIKLAYQQDSMEISSFWLSIKIA
jgi:hypothetical protein